jgi:hypothetical protein
MRLAYRLLPAEEKKLVGSLEVQYFGFGRSTGEDIEGVRPHPTMCSASSRNLLNIDIT